MDPQRPLPQHGRKGPKPGIILSIISLVLQVVAMAAVIFLVATGRLK